MAESSTALTLSNATAALRQVGLLVGIAASVAIGVGVVLWSQTPNYSLLYGNLSERDVGQIMEVLQSAEIPYKIEQATGAVLVPSSKVYEARMKLASAGIPKSASVGFEMLEKEQGFGTSQFIEHARYQRALEEELGRSIAKLNNVRAARVHLALPKQSVFTRDRKEPSASVLVDLYAGRILEQGQVQAIAHLVAASVPNLQMSAVTIIDQQGRLLTGSEASEQMKESMRRLDYSKQLEQSYVARIEDILVPIVGRDGVKAQVNADLDFTAVEQTSETFNPDLPAVRSEQLMQEQKTGPDAAGVPGALSNQPPGPAAAPETTANAPAQPGQAGQAAAQTTPQNTRKQETRNFEIDKTISHSKLAVGNLRRLSVAVLVNNKQSMGEDGKAVTTELTPEELARITGLVKETIGFDAARGDTVNVINANFAPPVAPEALPEPPIWERPWVWDAAKQIAGFLFASLVVFNVLRPTMRAMMKRPEPPAAPTARTAQMPALPGVTTATNQLEALGAAAAGGADAPPNSARGLLNMPQNDAEMETLKEYVKQESKLAAQVVKSWIGSDA